MKHTGMEIDIVRDTFTALKATVWKDFKTVLVKHGIYNQNHHNKTDKQYILNGNVISYYGADNPEKIHGRSRDILWINEGQHMPEETIDQLLPRTKYRVVVDYNPAIGEEHWLDRFIEKYPPLITTYRDNPHLTKEQVIEIESFKANPYWWSVYGSGERAKLVGLIFDNYEVGPIDTSLPFLYGMDFGYTQDPSTLIRTRIDRKRMIIYGEELLYSTGLSTNDIADYLTSVTAPEELIIADSAEPRLIDELYYKGFNIEGAIKGPDSVRLGLSKMAGYKLIISDNSPNLKKELNKYKWHQKKSNTPEDKNNHLIDAWRYSFDELTRDD
jgi:phage terminase large subunit